MKDRSFSFSPVVVPVDLSEADRRVLPVLKGLPLSHGATVILLHVVEPLQDTPYNQLKDFYRGLEEKAHEKMLTLVSELAEAGLNCRREIVYGDRVKAIVDFVRSEEAPFMVLRSHEIDPASAHEQLGTISHRVALYSPCSVLIVR